MQFKERRPAVRTLTVAGLQTAPVALDPEATLERFEDDVRAVRDTFGEVQLVVAPELLLAGVSHVLREPAGYAPEVAVDVPGPLTDRLARLAAETGLWLRARGGPPGGGGGPPGPPPGRCPPPRRAPLAP